MEEKVSGSRRIGLTASTLCLAFALPLSTPASGGGGVTGGSTEITQLMNNAELVAQVGEAVQTTANTLMTAQSTMQQLRQLPTAVVDKALAGLPVKQVQAMADAYRVMSQAVSVYKDAEMLMRQVARDAEDLKVQPSQLLRARASAALARGGIYAKSYEADIDRIKRAAEMSREVQKQAEVLKGIDSTVGGIQALASQNIAMQSTMSELTASIAAANANASMEAKRRQDSEHAYQKQAENDQKKIGAAQDAAKKYTFDSSGLYSGLK